MRLSGASADEADYQLDFLIPGIFPSLANSRKQIRHKPNFPMNPRTRPHFQQRLTTRVENFGWRFDFAFCACVAISFVFDYW